MIVRRMINALRRQDWTAVTIEFLLVLVGVLLAFQINEWASEREAKAEREAATERLLYEAEDDVAYFRAMVENHEETVRDLSYALSQLQSGTWREADKTKMLTGLTYSVYLDVPSPPSSVYEDIVAGGMLGKIGDPQLRSAISSYRAKLELLATLINYVRQIAPKFDREDSLRYVYNAAGPRPARLEVDFAALAKDRKAQSSLALLNDRQWFILRTWRQASQAADAMCRELGRKLKRPCDLQHHRGAED
jgi:hypothetical protein